MNTLPLAGVTTLLAAAAVWVMVRGPARRWWLAFGLGSALLLGVVALRGLEIDAFMIAKVVSVAAAGLVVALFRGAPSRWAARAPQLIVWLFAINMLEAVAAEAAAGGYVNALAGALLCVTMPWPEHVRAERDDAAVWVRYEIGWSWILAYTLWNLAFVSGTAPPGEPRGGFMWLAGAHLLIPLWWARRDPGRWAEGRVVALLFALVWLEALRGTGGAPCEPWIGALPLAVMQRVALAWAVALLARDLAFSPARGRTLASALGRRLRGG